MNIQRLESIKRDESNSNTLQDIPDDFYTNVENTLIDLRERRNELANEYDDPYESREFNKLLNKIYNIERNLESIYDQRVGKIVRQAVLEGSGTTFDKGTLLALETELYNDITSAVSHNRTQALRTISEGGPSRPPEHTNSHDSTGTVERVANDDTTTDDTSSNSPSQEASAFMGTDDPEPPADTSDSPSENTPERSGGYSKDVPFGDNADNGESSNVDSGASTSDESGEPTSQDDFTAEFTSASDTDTDTLDTTPQELPEEPKDNNPPQQTDGGTPTPPPDDASQDTFDRTTVRITQDVGEIFAIDQRTYTLETDDVVTLPTENVEPLIERNAAEALD